LNEFNGTVLLLKVLGIVVIGGLIIWFSVDARPLGPLRYRWGTFLGLQCVILPLILLLPRMIEAMRDGGTEEAIFWGIITTLPPVAAVGLLLRKRWGAVMFILMQSAFLVLPAVLASPEDLPPLSRAITGFVWLAINTWYFARRWPHLSAAAPTEPAAAGGADDAQVR
jgi:hypothetical protein